MLYVTAIKGFFNIKKNKYFLETFDRRRSVTSNEGMTTSVETKSRDMIYYFHITITFILHYNIFFAFLTNHVLQVNRRTLVF